MRRHVVAMLAMMLITPLATGVKCVDYDPVFSADAVLADSAGPGGFVPAEACSDPGTAEIDVEAQAFLNGCGCLEKRGKRQCTVPAGTTITWRFADSEEHNVKSQGDSFGASDDKLTGTWSATFDVPGTYDYQCGLHKAEMSDYAIIVLDPEE